MVATFRFFLLFVIAGSAVAEVRVSFPHPERYTDAGKYYDESETTRRTLERHLEALGKRYLPPGRTLAVEVLDIDLAGRYEPRGPELREVRIVRDGGDHPLLKLRYVLQAEGRTLASGEESIADTNYRFHGTTFSSSAPLSHEKRMLHDWFRTRFVEQSLAQGK